MKKQLGFTISEICAIIALFIIAIGYIWNLYKIYISIQEPITAFIVLRIIGIPIPFLGAIIGYF